MHTFPVRFLRSVVSPASSLIPPSMSSSDLNSDVVGRLELDIDITPELAEREWDRLSSIVAMSTSSSTSSPGTSPWDLLIQSSWSPVWAFLYFFCETLRVELVQGASVVISLVAIHLPCLDALARLAFRVSVFLNGLALCSVDCCPERPLAILLLSFAAVGKFFTGFRVIKDSLS